jgi:PleD family two-component response regulator
LSLAAKQGEGSSKPSQSSDDNSSRNNKLANILIADDSNTERTHLKKVLESAGYHVLVASSGKEALSIAQSELPDLILLDIIMENGDGYQTCRSLKRNAVTEHIPVIMVSSKSNAVDQQWAKKLGALDYIIKPYSDQELLQRLTEV